MGNGFRKKWAVLFGATEYEHVGTLKYCTRDVQALSAVLQRSLGFEETNILEFGQGLSHPPEYALFWHVLEETLAQWEVGEDDLLLFYFSGHGFRQGEKDYLVPVDGSVGTLERTGIEVEELIKELTDTGCRNVVTVFDACRDMVSGAKGSVGFGEVSGSLSERKGVVSFFSCAPKDQSWEIDDLKHSSFTYCLVDAIQTGVAATVGDMSEHLRKHVPLLNARHQKPTQQPWAAIVPDDKRHLAIFGAPPPPEPPEQYGVMIEQLYALYDSQKLEPTYFQAATELLDRIIGAPPSTVLTADQERRLRAITHLCAGTFTPVVFRRTWDMIDKRPQPGPSTSMLLKPNPSTTPVLRLA
jgi:hypothetical protein